MAQTDKPYAHYLTIVQSSGSSKSRLVGELRTKKIFVLYICKCNETSTGYLSTPCIQQIFEAIHNNKFGTLLSLAIKQIKAKNWNEEEFWSIQTKAEHKNECRDFWNSIFKSLEQVELSSDCRIPLWGSFAQSGVSLINLIHLASQKIRNFSKNDKDYLANLACTACTLALEVSPRIAEVDILIASHMETAIGVSLDRTSILCTYPSDPILASEALLRLVGKTAWTHCWNCLVVGSRSWRKGELANRVIF
ncbi:unnamed protein product [Rhizophagus irregularis]|nr:unnamed protein product [Rhizophagus irregularis]